eukprot:NODE_74_length_1728_cov_58.962523_g73_i0.p1 GENE.NODE_74_length_1728_cov_58.962523_g73_i0~~NODE_74_length_1728_cov_58.962523_g73_i0.p1  ORF type:complete len:553 (-),score=124.15 NODE_74_length_1728_cov_58.962523_g73_i0:69-1700(-)
MGNGEWQYYGFGRNTPARVSPGMLVTIHGAYDSGKVGVSYTCHFQCAHVGHTGFAASSAASLVATNYLQCPAPPQFPSVRPGQDCSMALTLMYDQKNAISLPWSSSAHFSFSLEGEATASPQSSDVAIAVPPHSPAGVVSPGQKITFTVQTSCTAIMVFSDYPATLDIYWNGTEWSAGLENRHMSPLKCINYFRPNDQVPIEILFTDNQTRIYDKPQQVSTWADGDWNIIQVNIDKGAIELYQTKWPLYELDCYLYDPNVPGSTHWPLSCPVPGGDPTRYWYLGEIVECEITEQMAETYPPVTSLGYIAIDCDIHVPLLPNTKQPPKDTTSIDFFQNDVPYIGFMLGVEIVSADIGQHVPVNGHFLWDDAKYWYECFWLNVDNKVESYPDRALKTSLPNSQLTCVAPGISAFATYPVAASLQIKRYFRDQVTPQLMPGVFAVELTGKYAPIHVPPSPSEPSPYNPFTPSAPHYIPIHNPLPPTQPSEPAPFIAPPSNKGGHNAGKTAGIVIGILLGVAVIVGAVGGYVFWFKRKKHQGFVAIQ